MDSISSINTQLSPELLTSSFPVPQTRHSTMAPVEAIKNDSEQGYESYDFTSYNPDVEGGDPLTTAGNAVANSVGNLGDAMISALENGFSVQDACNIKLAQIAYKASCAVFKTAISTFDIGI